MPENNPQDPRSLWKTETDPSTGKVTITNPENDPWDTEVLLELPLDHQHALRTWEPNPSHPHLWEPIHQYREAGTVFPIPAQG